MIELFHKIWDFMNHVKDFTVGYDVAHSKMLFEYKGKRWVAEFREVENQSENIVDDMRRIKYL